MKYKSRKRNIILDVLFRFININEGFFQFYYIKLDTLYNYTYITTFIKINNKFKIRIAKNYELNSL